MSETYERKRVEWLVMLYLSGDNNLSPEMVWAINEIRTSRVPKGFALTIQFDGVTPGSPTVRYAIDETTPVNPGPTLGPIPFPEAEKEWLPEADAGDPKVLEDFMRWSMRSYQPEHRMLILSGHGSGTVGDFLTDDDARQQLQPGSMSIPGVAEAIRKASENNPYLDLKDGDDAVDILGLDSCLMSTLEVAVELKGRARLLVASEGFVPNTGWPYGYLLDCLADHVKQGDPIDPVSVSKYLVHDCANYYATYLPAGVSFDIASCDIDRIELVILALNGLTSELLPFTEKAVQDGVVLAHWRAQSFKWEQYVDLWDFCDQLRLQVGENGGELRSACDSVMNHIGDPSDQGDSSLRAVVAHETVGIEFQHAHGLSVFFPWSIPKFETPDWFTLYRGLQFASESKWLPFLQCYAAKTMRQPAELHTSEPTIELPVKVATARSAAVGIAASATAIDTSVGIPHRPGVKVSSEVHTRVSSEVHTRGMWPFGTMKNPPQTVKIPQRLLVQRGAGAAR